MKNNWVAATLNSGTHPEPRYWALAAANLGAKSFYLTSSSFASDNLIMLVASSKPLRRTSAGRLLTRRRLPAILHPVSVVGIARASALREEMLKFSGVEGDALVERRMTAYRAGTARWQRARSARLIVAQYTSALSAFQVGVDAIKVLLYPIAHHQWMESHLTAEAAANPDWAEFLQGAELSDERRRLLDREIELASCIVVPSNFARQTFIESGVDPAKVHVLTLGADVFDSPETNDWVADRPATKSTLKILFAGQLNQRKGLSYLLEAVADLGDQIDLRLIGPASDAMRERLRRDYPSVQVSHPLSRPELLEAMRGADLLVLPSLAEGFGLVALEAMSVGTPAIVTDRTFGADIISHGEDGWIVEAASASALRALLTELDHDRDRLARIAEASRKTSQRHTWTSYTESARQFLEQLLDASA